MSLYGATVCSWIRESKINKQWLQIKQTAEAVTAPRRLLVSSKLPGKARCSVSLLPFHTAVHLGWASLNCHTVWVINLFLLYVHLSGGVGAFPCHKAGNSQWQRNCHKMCFPLEVHPPSSPSRLLPGPHHMPWAGGSGPVTVFFPGLCAMDSFYWGHSISLWRSAPVQKTLQALLGHLQQRRWTLEGIQVLAPQQSSWEVQG